MATEINTKEIKDAAVTDVKLANNYARILDMDVTETEVVNTATETTIYTYSVPANTLGTANVLRVALTGQVKNDGAGAGTFRVKYGATTLITIGTGPIPSNYNGVLMEIILFADTSTSAQYASAHITRADSPWRVLSGFGTAAEDSTGTLSLTITWQSGSAGTNRGFKKKAAMTELLEN